MNAPLSPAAWLRWQALQPFLSAMEPGLPLVEIGCGVGGFASRLDRRFRYIGYEPDEISARLAARRVKFGEIRNKPLPAEPEGLFDIFAAFEVIEHFEDDIATLAAWRTWLTSGGRILLSTPADPDRFGPWDWRAGHYRRYSPEGLEQALDEAGFRNVEIRWYGAPLLYLTEFVRNRLAGEGAGHMEARTAVSGRQLQPSRLWGWVTWIGTMPFRYLQIPIARMGYGTGLIATATVP